MQKNTWHFPAKYTVDQADLNENFNYLQLIHNTLIKP